MEQKELKFMVWDNENYMSDPFTFQGIMRNEIEFTTECPVLQYIGLNDMTDKEIYSDFVLQDRNGQRYVVEWIEQMAGWYLRPVGSQRGRTIISCAASKHLGETMQLCNLEIIGNIYENPELIK